FGLERDHRGDRTEDLFARDAPCVVDVGEDARAEEVPGSLRDLTARHGPCALLLPDLDVLERGLALPFADQRAHLGGLVQRLTEPDPLGPLGEPRDELVVDRPRDQVAGPGTAVWARVVEDRPQRLLDAGGGGG